MQSIIFRVLLRAESPRQHCTQGHTRRGRAALAGAAAAGPGLLVSLRTALCSSKQPIVSHKSKCANK